jgi:D-alanyl-lipoteichoic acid acyltransferase DltB (MBOAT superfamily)
MLFNSLQFLIFFFIVTAAYFVLPHRVRWILLVIASCYFYMVLVPEYILILIFLILIDYSAGLLIERTQGRLRKIILIASIISNVGLLGIFKYFNFINYNLYSLFSFFGWHYDIGNLSLILPIGLSFHTFQSMSYTIEVYRGRYKAEHRLGIYALYVLFYPQMVAGPIERPQNLLHQLHDKKTFDYQRVADGLKQMAWGLFKKVVVADRLALFVNAVYNDPQNYKGFPLIVATYFFSFQIYCDFSGYSDIAIGAAKVMGIRIMDNFKLPYHAKSIGEFWRRWHISLSSWLRDYLFLPIAYFATRKFDHVKIFKVRPDILGYGIGIFITMFLGGLWHGANYTFILWGILHGFYQVFSLITQRIRNRLARSVRLSNYPSIQKGIKIFITFHLVTFAWILFRAKSIEDAWYIITNMFQIQSISSVLNLGFTRFDMLVAICAIFVMETIHILQCRQSIIQRLRTQPSWSRWALYAGAVMIILLFGEFNSLDFIYFQF